MQPSFADLRWYSLRLRLLRAFPRARLGTLMVGVRETNAPASPVKDADGFEVGAPENWGRYLKRLDERLMSPDAYSVAPVAKTIAGVVTYGLNQLEAASGAPGAGDIPPLDQRSQDPVNVTLTLEVESQPDFIERWGDAIGREMGAEEIEKLGLAMREAHHERTTLDNL